MLFRRLSIFVLIIVSLFGAWGCHEGGEEGLPPIVALSGGKVFPVKLGESCTVSPSFEHLTDQAVIRWLVNGETVGTGETFTFTPDAPGVYYITVEVTTEWGRDFLEIRFDVYDDTPPPEPPMPPVDSVDITFERSEYHVALGRAIRLLPFGIDTTKDCTFCWNLDGTTVQQGPDPLYRFEAVQQGSHTVGFRMFVDGQAVAEHTLTVLVCPPEGTYHRSAAAGSAPNCNRVFDFTPAPGQFINENYTATTMEEACAYAFARMQDGNYVSLGGFGGSLVVGFDHSVACSGGYDFAVRNSVYTNYSEPGIVWVMQDEDGNGLPDDTWYELKGSEYGLDCTLQDYAVTYYRPEAPGRPVAWTDNRGGSGSIDYLSAYHRQDYYYPAWIGPDSYTLRGTRLEARNYDASGSGVLWINPDYGWGYADNFSPIDMLPDEATGITAGCNHFRIADAVTFDGKPASLQYIDFVKVQTGLNAKSGWLGELSTEVMDVIDYNLVK